MIFSVVHPEYYGKDRVLDVPNQQGSINLGVKLIEHSKVINDRALAMEVEFARENDRGEDYINNLIEKRRYIPEIARLYPEYYAVLLDLGREDVFDKYWPVYFEEYAKLEGLIGEKKKSEKALRLEIIERQRR